ncbi:MAG TPA: hypothetical protein VNZ26_09695 [Vicinamibacterales bacterium]|nr:hypothetical protein [Vicinamibacterales bacterium]
MGPRFHRFSVVMFLAAALMGGGMAPLAGQAPHLARPPRAPWSPPRTPDGQPDLQGYWTNATFTPLERPKELGTKEFYTAAEAAAVERQKILEENSQSPDDVHYDNAIWQGERYEKIVSNRRTSMIFDPPDGRMPPLSVEGQRRAANMAAAARRREAAESAQDRSLAERCISWGSEGPPMIGSTYNANLQILQTRQSVVILHEINHVVRTIRLDDRSHLPGAIRQLNGDSRGQWDGHTLVVESTNFSDKTPFRGPPSNTRQDIFSDENLHVVERFTPTDANTIVYRFTVDDPTVWTKPWSGELVMRRFEGLIFEYACHEGNYGLRNILAGARKAEAEAVKKR